VINLTDEEDFTLSDNSAEFEKLFNISSKFFEKHEIIKSDIRPKEDNSMLKGQSIELDLDELLGNKSSFEQEETPSSEMIKTESPHDFIKIEDSNESSKRDIPPITIYSTRLSTKTI
jgi:hypothetical protein